MAVTQVSDLSSLFNTIYEDALFVARETNLMSQLVENRSGKGWMTRVVPIRPAIAAVAVAETEDFNSPTTFGLTTKATLTPAEVIAQVVLTDRDMDTDPHGAVQDATFELGGSIATKIDEDLIALFPSLGSDVGAGAGNPATLTTISRGVAVLRNEKAQQYGKIAIVLHPYHWHDIYVEIGVPSTSLPASEFANKALRDYFVSDMIGANWFVSANISVDASDDAISGIFVPPAMMLDTRRPMRLETERDASARAYEMNMTAGYAVGVVRSEFGVEYTADAA